MNNNEIKIYDKELESRISEMERTEYKFPKKFSMWDIEAAICAGLFCLAMIIIGVFL